MMNGKLLFQAMREIDAQLILDAAPGAWAKRRRGVMWAKWGALAACLLVLYAAVFFLRSLAEPHLLSRKLGIHPLLSLFCMYGGYRLFGVWMMILAPLLASLAVSFLRSYAAEGKAKTKK